MNHENALLDALSELLLANSEVPLHGGGIESIVGVSVGSEQFNVGYPAVALIPVGAGVFGRGAGHARHEPAQPLRDGKRRGGL